MAAGDHAAEVDALGRRFPGWTIWFGPSTGHWWALPPRDRDVGDFLEADTPQRLIARIEVVTRAARRRPPARGPARRQHDQQHDQQHDGGPRRPSRDPRQDVRRPSNLLRLEGVTPPHSGRVPVIAWPGSTAR
ncbi:hypothetical protein HUT06_12815 [Actinomadura sp. NAK00032]|uniref:hypothetical protein n=1 Tax=Actinomadura sp. NAK00032 TaxID=2742128 RepID=UPI0015928D74|nr:hypothetical protein [Actinomadura sp. NAK00032]QKW34800.1 hypothetical protein HUT06_12815 [Actinomadura sp. NAK00032]